MRPTGSITAHPNPIEVVDHPVLGETVLSWTANGVEQVEVHVGAPDGPLFCRSGPSGSKTIGKWVREGMTFYLQDASPCRRHNAENTLATVTVRVDASRLVAGMLGVSTCRIMDALATIIQRQLGQRPTVGHVHLKPSMTLHCEARVPTGVVLFKGALCDAPSTIAVEAWVCERVRQLDIPSPRVLAVDNSKRFFPGPYLIMEKLPGQLLDELRLPSGRLRPLLRQVGRCLRQIHRVQLEGFGYPDAELYLSEGTISGSHETWRDALMHALCCDLPYLERHALVSGETSGSIWKLLDRYDDLLRQCDDGRLLHGDLHSAHILVDRETERVTGIIDFGEAQSGDPAWDLALFGLWEEAQRLDYLLEGYEPDEGVTRDLSVKIPFYRLLQATSLTRWAHEYWLIEHVPRRWRAYLEEGLELEW